MRPQDTQAASGRDIEDDDELGELVFFNTDAIPKQATVTCSRASIPLIMAWYGGYYAGDRYSVTFNGEQLEKDRNGELVE